MERSAAPAVLLLDTGDALVGGGILGEKTQGAAIIAGMSQMGYDAMVLGPNELTLGRTVLDIRIQAAAFPIVSANVVVTGTGELYVQPHAMLESAGLRLAVVGITRMPDAQVSGFEVLAPDLVAADAVAQVRGEADVVVVLTNLSYRTAMDLASSVAGIDLVVAAQPGQLPRSAVTAPGTEALVVAAEQPLARHTGRRVGKLVLTVLGDGSLIAESWESRPLDASFADDKEMAALLDLYR